MPITHRRRGFIASLALAGAGFVYLPKLLAGEERLETTTVRLAKKIPVLCNAPQYIAGGPKALATFSMSFQGRARP
jgi:hypothetical protein